eukprot:GHVT01002985.1.p1 GENE.GHVT01002985.1~~GHVT01002985.1.p1  ORF type:complete len:1540 (-),score=312.60 GHVT01002985.1:1367-5986(-)
MPSAVAPGACSYSVPRRPTASDARPPSREMAGHSHCRPCDCPTTGAAPIDSVILPAVSAATSSLGRAPTLPENRAFESRAWSDDGAPRQLGASAVGGQSLALPLPSVQAHSSVSGSVGGDAWQPVAGGSPSDTGSSWGGLLRWSGTATATTTTTTATAATTQTDEAAESPAYLASLSTTGSPAAAESFCASTATTAIEGLVPSCANAHAAVFHGLPADAPPTATLAPGTAGLPLSFFQSLRARLYPAALQRTAGSQALENAPAAPPTASGGRAPAAADSCRRSTGVPDASRQQPAAFTGGSTRRCESYVNNGPPPSCHCKCLSCQTCECLPPCPCEKQCFTSHQCLDCTSSCSSGPSSCSSCCSSASFSCSSASSSSSSSHAPASLGAVVSCSSSGKFPSLGAAGWSGRSSTCDTSRLAPSLSVCSSSSAGSGFPYVGSSGVSLPSLDSSRSSSSSSRRFGSSSSSCLGNGGGCFVSFFRRLIAGICHGWGFTRQPAAKYNYYVNEFFAGFTVALSQIPSTLSFAFIANVPVMMALSGTWIVGFITAVFGSAPGAVSNVTANTAAAISNYVSKECHEGVCTYTNLELLVPGVMFAALLCLLAGSLRLARLVQLIPSTIMIGFANGIALINLKAQLKLFRWTDSNPGGGWTVEVLLYWMWLSIIIAAVVTVSELWPKLPKIGRLIPSSLVALSVSAFLEFVVVRLLFGMSTPTVGSQTTLLREEIWPQPFFLPSSIISRNALLNPNPFVYDAKAIKDAAALGFSLFSVIFISSLLTIEMIDERVGTSSDADGQLLGLGAANMLAGLLSAMPGSTAASRSLLNFNAGGRGKESGVFAALFVFTTVTFVYPLLNIIPLAGLSGLILLTAFKTFKWWSLPMLLATFLPQRVRRACNLPPVSRWCSCGPYTGRRTAAKGEEQAEKSRSNQLCKLGLGGGNSRKSIAAKKEPTVMDAAPSMEQDQKRPRNAIANAPTLQGTPMSRFDGCEADHTPAGKQDQAGFECNAHKQQQQQRQPPVTRQECKTKTCLAFKKIDRLDAIVIIATTTLTVVVDLGVAVFAGLFISACGYAWNSLRMFSVERRVDVEQSIAYYELRGPVFFAAKKKLLRAFNTKADPQTVHLLIHSDSRLHDFTSMECLSELEKRYRKAGKRFIIQGLSPECRKMLIKAGDVVEVTQQHFVAAPPHTTVPMLHCVEGLVDGITSDTEDCCEQPLRRPDVNYNGTTGAQNESSSDTDFESWSAAVRNDRSAKTRPRRKPDASAYRHEYCNGRDGKNRRRHPRIRLAVGEETETDQYEDEPNDQLPHLNEPHFHGEEEARETPAPKRTRLTTASPRWPTRGSSYPGLSTRRETPPPGAAGRLSTRRSDSSLGVPNRSPQTVNIVDTGRTSGADVLPQERSRSSRRHLERNPRRRHDSSQCLAAYPNSHQHDCSTRQLVGRVGTSRRNHGRRAARRHVATGALPSPRLTAAVVTVTLPGGVAGAEASTGPRLDAPATHPLRRSTDGSLYADQRQARQRPSQYVAEGDAQPDDAATGSMLDKGPPSEP